MELIVRVRPGGRSAGADEEREERVEVGRNGGAYRVRVGERSYRVDVVAAGPPARGVRSLLVAGRQHEVVIRRLDERRYRVSSREGEQVVEVLDPLSHLAEKAHARAATSGLARVVAYMPGRVVELLVEEGQEVAAGQGLLVLEAMKMENEIQAERAGTVRRILVERGEAVDGGDPLVEIEGG